MVTRWAGGWRRALALIGSVLCGAILVAAPARADVTVTPDRAVRGEAAKLTFRVTDERGAAYTTKIELLLPESAPIAEVWPLTVPDWAPSVVTRKLDRPLEGLHHGRIDEVTSQITWIRADAAKPADAAELQVSLGPMPETDRLVFTVVQTYSDGTVVRWDGQPAGDGSPVENQAAMVTLTDSTVAAPGGADGGAHGGTHGGNAGTTDQRAAEGGEDDSGGFGSLATGLLIGLLVGAGVAVWLARGRRGPAAAGVAEETTEGTAGTAGEAGAEAGSGSIRQPVSTRRAWRLHE